MSTSPLLTRRISEKPAKIYAGHPITETLTNGFFAVDKQWTVKYWNKAAEKILAVEAKDIVGKNLWERFAGVLPLEFYSVYQKAFQQQLPVHFEEYWGEMRAWFDVVSYYCEDTLSISFKSSNHPHAEYPESPVQRLRTLTELYRFVTEITNDALWEWDIHTQEIFWIDGGHKRMFDYQLENALIPQAFWENCIHVEDRQRVLGKLGKVLQEASSNLWEDEYRFAKADGTYAHVCDRGHIIYEEGKAVRMIGATQDISTRVFLQEQLDATRVDKQRVETDAMIGATERTRVNIGRQLHDNFAQLLAAINIYLQAGRKNRPENHFLEICSQHILTLAREIKKLYITLILPDKILGLKDSITLLAEQAAKEHKIRIDLELNFDEKGISEKLQMMIYRIVQEQLENIVQHAEAKTVTISISISHDVLHLYIKDDGKGWTPTAKRKGLGITNIITSVEMVQGSASIESRPQEGFTLKVLVQLA
jgi:PAS domain S-box-containing protein